jgi:opacity protein-like surface antigen
MTARSLVLIAALLAAAQAAAQPSSRAGTWEIYIGPEFTDGKDYTFDGGSSAKTDTGVGLNIGFAKNFDRRWAAGIDVVWAEQDYRATVQPGVGNTNSARQISGQIDWRTIRFFGTFHFSEGNFTPFVTAGLGWTYIDTNIPSGPPENLCWYYPWYGYYCSTYVPTETSTEFSYNAGLGLRLDAGKGVFRFLVNSQWVDFANYSSNVIQYRIDIGTKF